MMNVPQHVIIRRWLSLVLLLIFANLNNPPLAHAQEGPGDTVRAYLPFAGRDYKPSWAWEELANPPLSPDPYQTAILVDRQGRTHVFWSTIYYAAPRFI